MSEKTEEDQLEAALEEKPTPAVDTLPDDDASAIVDPADKKPDKKAKKKAAPKKGRQPIVTESVTESVTDAAGEKRQADSKRRDQAIKDAPRPPDPSKADKAEQKRKAGIRDKMAETAAELVELDAQTDEKKDELRALSSELYPHLGESDHLVVAVKGYIASQKRLRATRASNPETLKRMLALAGKAPIDAAMARKNTRGTARPTGPGVIPSKTAAKE